MKKIVMITCTSFTVIILAFAILSPYNIIPGLSKTIVFQLFTMALSVAVAMFLGEQISDKLEWNSLPADALIRGVICYAVVVIEGSLFGMFPFGWQALISVSPVLIPAFVLTYVVGYYYICDSVKAINNNIKLKN